MQDDQNAPVPNDANSSGFPSVSGAPLMRTDPTPDAVTPDMTTLKQQLDELREAFDSKLRYDRKKDEQIEQLHAELETYKRGERENVQRAIVADMIRLSDDMEDLIAASDLPADSPVQRSLVAFKKGIIETLMRNGVEPYTVETPTYDRTLQRPLQVIATQDASRDMTVARRVRVGFRSADRIVRQELVDVYRLS